MNWFEMLLPSKIRTSGGNDKKNVPEGLWAKCDSCDAIIYRAELERNQEVCTKCDFHMRIGARRRLEGFFDEEGRSEIGAQLEADDVLKFRDDRKYRERLSQAQKQTGEKDALIVMRGTVMGVEMVAAAFEFRFMGGSMGSVVGEKFVRAANTSGGARMQEALFSLLQMAKTSAALTRLSRRGMPYICVLTDPTMGGVSASFAMLGDIHIAEPGALIGFAGPRVIEQTVRETLPEGFQRSEFLLDHGAVDMIVDRPC